MTILLTLTSIGANAGPFMIYTNSDGFTNPVFGVPVTAEELALGFTSSAYPEDTTTLQIVSVGACENSIFIEVESIITTTTTSSSSTTSTSSTTTTTTTATPTTTTTTTGLPGNIYVENNALSSSVEDFSEITTSLVFPIIAGSNELGTHTGVTTRFIIDMLIINPVCIRVYANGIFLVEDTASVSGLVTMFTGDILASAYIEVIISEGAC
jgi:hypothetical protein